MKKSGFIFFTLFLISSHIYAFEQFQVGVRSQSLGGAFTGLADDIEAVIYNPAGIGEFDLINLAAEHSFMYTGIDNATIGSSFLAMAFPIANNLGVVSISWNNMAVYDVYSENTLRLSFGKSFTKIPSLFKALYVGASVNYLAVNYTSALQLINDPFFGGSVYNSKANLGVDVGILAKIGNHFSIGLAGFNLNNPDLGISEDNTIEAVYRVGAAYKFIINNEYIQGINILADFVDNYNEQKICAGLEVLVFNIINLRTGYNSGVFTLGIGCNYELEDMFCNINYAYSASSMDIPGLMNHRLSIGMKF